VFGWIDPPGKLIPLLDAAGIDKAVAMTYVDVPGSNPEAVSISRGRSDGFPSD
jgi:hypothetical protein